MRDAPFLEMTARDWEAVIAVNLTGAFHCAHAAAPHMAAQSHGRIINIASTNAFSPSSFAEGVVVGCANYAASKAGVLGLTWGPRGRAGAIRHHLQRDPAAGDNPTDARGEGAA
jgi:NAD(P)-dependent dehydrogenase (short-subunit alcohol dehydrogenase family)